MNTPKLRPEMIDVIHRAFDRRTPTATEILINIAAARDRRAANLQLRPANPDLLDTRPKAAKP